MELIKIWLDKWALRCHKCGTWGYNVRYRRSVLGVSDPTLPQPMSPFDVWVRKICRRKNCGRTMSSKIFWDSGVG